jgi:hypothetical protein
MSSNTFKTHLLKTQVVKIFAPSGSGGAPVDHRLERYERIQGLYGLEMFPLLRKVLDL